MSARRPAPPPLRLLQATSFVSTLDRFAMPPMLVAIAHDLGVPLSASVQAAGIYFLAYGACQPLWGTVSDRLGRVRTMRLTLLLAGLATLASTLSGSVAVLTLTRAIAGALFGAAYPSSLIYLGDTVPAQVRQRDIASLMVGVALSTALASLGAGALAALTSWRLAFAVTGVAAIVLAFVLRALPEPDVARPSGSAWRPLAEISRSRSTLFVLVLAFLEGAVLLGLLTLLPASVESDGASAAVAGAVTGLYGVSVFVCARLVGRLSQRGRPALLIALGASAAVVACVALSLSRAPAVAAVAAVLTGFAWVSMHSTLQTWATEVLPSARANVVSLFAGSLFVGSALGAVVFAGSAEDGRYGVVFGAYAVLAVPLGLAGAWGRGRWRGDRPAAPPVAP